LCGSGTQEVSLARLSSAGAASVEKLGSVKKKIFSEVQAHLLPPCCGAAVKFF
jgi:hypothetical protein